VLRSRLHVRVQADPVPLVLLRLHEEREGDHPQHDHLERVDLEVGDAAYTRVVRIVVVHVVEEFAREHDACDEQPMHVERADHKVRIELYDLVYVDEREDEGLLGATSVPQDTARGQRRGQRTTA